MFQGHHAIPVFALLMLPALFGRSFAVEHEPNASLTKPNFIIFLCDNLGYGDIGCFGSTRHRTPNIDRMAKQGRRFTHFYSTSGVCTPSRASLMTGCYPRRVNMHQSGAGSPVLKPADSKGLHPEEITIAEVLKQEGYASAIIGKWHLGDQPPFLPTRQGFDTYFGIPYSDDMTATEDGRRPPLPLMQNETVVEAPPDRNLLTQRYTERAIAFLEDHRDEPFFLYLPQAMPGSTRAPFASERFRGKSKNGPWGDSVEELDWSTGKILEALEKWKLDRNTLFIWTSDNGAPRRNPPQGSNLPLKGWGYTTTEGGQRVPCIMWWPGKIPADTTCDALTTMMDLLPTFAYLAGGEPPRDRIIDGHDIRPLLFDEPGTKSPYEAFYYYQIGQLQAVRSGPWKLYLPLDAKWRGLRRRGKPSDAELHHLKNDITEQKDLAKEHPDIVARLMQLAERARRDLGDGDREGKNQRPAGRVEDPTPRLLSESEE